MPRKDASDTFKKSQKILQAAEDRRSEEALRQKANTAHKLDVQASIAKLERLREEQRVRDLGRGNTFAGVPPPGPTPGPTPSGPSVFPTSSSGTDEEKKKKKKDKKKKKAKKKKKDQDAEQEDEDDEPNPDRKRVQTQTMRRRDRDHGPEHNAVDLGALDLESVIEIISAGVTQTHWFWPESLVMCCCRCNGRKKKFERLFCQLVTTHAIQRRVPITPPA